MQNRKYVCSYVAIYVRNVHWSQAKPIGAKLSSNSRRNIAQESTKNQITKQNDHYATVI